MKVHLNKLAMSLAFVATLSACSQSSTGRNQLLLHSSADLDKMGAQSFEQMKQQVPISSDAKVTAFVHCVADAITPNVQSSVHKGNWEVVVFDSDQINAFALPGGKIGVYTGILNVTENADQLAAIIGHEVGHVIEQHSNERLSSNQVSQIGLVVAGVAMSASDVDNSALILAGLGLGVQYGIIMPYGRAHETEADIVGQKLMAESGFNPKAAVKLWENMGKVSKGAPPEFFSTHPSHNTRISNLTNNLSVTEPIYSAQTNRPSCPKPAIPIPKKSS